MGQARCGRCAVFLVVALVLDAAGLALVLAGAVGKPTLAGCPFEDFLVLSGALLLFLSLLCWLFWYSGNLSGVPAEELPVGARPSHPQPRSRGSLALLAVKLSERLSQRRPFAPPASWSPAPGLSAGAATSAALAAAALSGRFSGPLELAHLRPPAHPPQATPEERLV